MQSSANVGFTGIGTDEIGLVWLQASKFLKPALRGDKTLDDVLAELYKKTAQLWIAATEDEMQSAWVTQIFHRGGRKLCNIWLCGGKGVNDWIHHVEIVEAWAKENGCDAVVIDQARIGWQRLLKNYKPLTMALERKL